MYRPTQKRSARALIVGSVVALAAGLTLVFAMTSGSSHASKAHVFASKLAAQEVVGNRGESDRSPDGEGPSSAAAQDYANQAYPANTIPIQLTLHAQAAWAGVKARGAARGPSRGSQWSLAGPSHADFPGVLTFSGADYTTSGRITALAVDPSCSQSRCRVWAAAAGGGIWRTTNALSGNGAGWTYVSGALPTNAIGTLLYRNGVLYAGTGEPNASVDSESGLGLYKSTDGGDTWTRLAAQTSVPADTVDCTAAVGTGGIQTAPAYNGPAFDGRAISTIVVNGSTIYVASARSVRGVSSVLSGGVVSLGSGASAVRPLEVHGRRRDVHAAERAGDLPESDPAGPGGHHPVELRLDARCDQGRARSERLEHGLRVGVPAEQPRPDQHQRRRLALHRQRGELDADQDRAQPDAQHRPDRVLGAAAPEREHADVRRRRHVERSPAPARLASIAPTTPRGEPGVHGHDDETRTSATAPRSAGTTTSSTRLRASRTSSTSAARTPTGHTGSPPTAVRSSARPTPVRRSPT